MILWSRRMNWRRRLWRCRPMSDMSSGKRPISRLLLHDPEFNEPGMRISHHLDPRSFHVSHVRSVLLVFWLILVESVIVLSVVGFKDGAL